MGISSLTFSSGIQPTKPYNAGLYQTNAVLSTYYTVLNVTAGKGIVQRVAVESFQSSSGFANVAYLKIRFTVDGGTAIVIDGSVGDSYLRGNLLTSARFSYDNLIFQSPVYFTKSILIEVIQTYNAPATYLSASVDYSLV